MRVGIELKKSVGPQLRTKDRTMIESIIANMILSWYLTAFVVLPVFCVVALFRGKWRRPNG